MAEKGPDWRVIKELRDRTGQRKFLKFLKDTFSEEMGFIDGFTVDNILDKSLAKKRDPTLRKLTSLIEDGEITCQTIEGIRKYKFKKDEEK